MHARASAGRLAGRAAALNDKSAADMDGILLSTAQQVDGQVPQLLEAREFARASVCESHYFFLPSSVPNKCIFQSKGECFIRKLRFSSEFSKFCKHLECFGIEILKGLEEIQ